MSSLLWCPVCRDVQSVVMSSIHWPSCPVCHLATVIHMTSDCWCGTLSLNSRWSLLSLLLCLRLSSVHSCQRYHLFIHSYQSDLTCVVFCPSLLCDVGSSSLQCIPKGSALGTPCISLGDPMFLSWGPHISPLGTPLNLVTILCHKTFMAKIASTDLTLRNDSLTHPLTHSVTHSFTHSCTHLTWSHSRRVGGGWLTKTAESIF